MTVAFERSSIAVADVVEVIARLRAKWEFDRDAAKAACAGRGVEPIGPCAKPPTDGELIGDYWWYSGMLIALEDLIDELEIDDE